MRMIDHAILFIFPIFTNLYFNFESDIWTDTTQKSAKLQRRAKARSHSTPNISESAYKSSLRKRFSSLIFDNFCKRCSASTYSSARPCFSWESTNAMSGHIISMQFKTIQYHAMQSHLWRVTIMCKTFYRTHVHMGSDHWVAMSVCPSLQDLFETLWRPSEDCQCCQCCEDLANED